MAKTSSRLSAIKNGSAREAILASIRRSLAISEPFDAAWREHHGHTAVAVPMTKPPFSIHQLMDNFRNSLDLLGARFSRSFRMKQPPPIMSGG